MKVKLVSIGTRREGLYAYPRRAIEVRLDTRDLWVGVFVDTNAIYVCPVPCLVLRFSRGTR